MDYVLMDAGNYTDDMPLLHREAVRGIIYVDGKMLLVQNDSGEVKLPGGGIENNETDEQALVREVMEETGRKVIVSSIRPFVTIEEKRASIKEYALYNQISRIYFCEVDNSQGETHYSAGEVRHHLHTVHMTLDEAIAANEKMLEREGYKPYNQREYKTFLMIREYVNKV